ncbi:MAG: DNA gyrase/topoisomerase IV subunit A [Saprospiraceae bacterium]|jgi:topoisomerase-4 subunit A
MAKIKDIDLENLEGNGGHPVSLEGMYKEYFLDYASYVILERAVPHINDGLKPVQRRILHSMKKMDDGRFHKVANIIGQTMQYHPHGDAAIGAALVNLGQKDLLVETQGNWGDYRTGDAAAAPRYIEARLTKFALEVVFNPQTTDWQISYDGRNKEPITLPVKFPLVLAQGVEGIAVGLSTKILPHNFNELIKASIKTLEEKRVKIYPDFPTGGLVDVSDYNSGKRGGKIRVRAKIEQRDKSTLAITELPYGVTTDSLIDSILKANDKGKIQIKKVIDNTAADVEIMLELPSGVSPDVSLDALYAFTNCEVSISPTAVVIIDNKPVFSSVEDLLKLSTESTKNLLRQELEIKKHELLEKWHGVSLEKIFIENRIYRDIEEAESFEQVITIIDKGLRKYVITPNEKAKKSDTRIKLNREISEDDIIRLTEIKIKKISKYNKFKTDEQLKAIEEELDQVNYDLKHLTPFAIKYFQNLLDKYGKGKERRTEITEFDTIKVKRVAAKNAKLYVNRKEGFIGSGLKKDEYICDCSDIDDIIAFTGAGIMKVVRVDDKVFIGKNILHTDVWKKADERTTYNMIYLDAKTGRAMAKRFNVTSITRDKDYDLTTAQKGNKVLYFAAHKNGEAETVQIQLTQACKAKKKIFEFDFAEIDIKGRGSKGNIVTKYPVRKITQLELGQSSLGAIKIWIDEVSGRINKEERGKYLGAFDTGDQIIALYKNGNYEVTELDFNKKFEASSLIDIGKLSDDTVVSCIYWEGSKGWTMVKRFMIETKSLNTPITFISDSDGSKLYYASLSEEPKLKYSYKANNKKVEHVMDVNDFIDVKGYKALGNKLGEFKVLKIEELETQKKTSSDNENGKSDEKEQGDLSPGDTIEFDF